jgi:SPP1 family predicted phage head-tail adaptor
MRAGELRHRVTIQQDTGTAVDGKGQPTESWATYCERSAARRALQGREGEMVRQRYADADYALVLRFDPTTALITPRMRVQEIIESVTRTFDIRSALDPDGRRREMELVVTERAL